MTALSDMVAASMLRLLMEDHEWGVEIRDEPGVYRVLRVICDTERPQVMYAGALGPELADVARIERVYAIVPCDCAAGRHAPMCPGFRNRSGRPFGEDVDLNEKNFHKPGVGPYPPGPPPFRDPDPDAQHQWWKDWRCEWWAAKEAKEAKQARNS